MRQSNVTNLRWDQVDMRRRVAWIFADQAKAKKPIGIPLSDLAMSVLEQQQAEEAARKAQDEEHTHSPWVFPYRGHPIGKIKSACGKALARAGIENFRWHDLRHTWASWHVMAGTPLEVLKELGGWADYHMVLRYTHLAPDHLAGYAGNAVPYQRVSQL